MTTKWTTNAFSTIGTDPIIDQDLLDESVVILLLGKNLFGDRIYSYVKLSVKKLLELRKAMRSGKDFMPSDFGEVIAAGKGEPSESIKRDLAEQGLKFVDPAHFKGKSLAATAGPIQPKLWDEY